MLYLSLRADSLRPSSSRTTTSGCRVEEEAGQPSDSPSGLLFVFVVELEVAGARGLEDGRSSNEDLLMRHQLETTHDDLEIRRVQDADFKAEK